MIKISVIVIFIFNFIHINAQTPDGETRKDSICVTMKELLSNPNKYSEKFVAVSGFIVLEKNGIREIYVSENDYIKKSSKKSIGLSFFFESSTHLTSSKYNKTYATIVGWFSKSEVITYNEYLGKKIISKNGMITDLHFYDKPK